jgi:hypothetical protein
VQLKKLLNQDQELAGAIAQILKENMPNGTPGTQIIQTVTGTKNQVIGQMTGENARYQILVPYVSDEEQAETEAEIGLPSDYEADEQIDMTDWVKHGNQIPQERN